MATPLGLPATTFDRNDRNNLFVLRTPSTGITTSYNTTTLTANAESITSGTWSDGSAYDGVVKWSSVIKADEVLLIDKVVIRAQTLDNGFQLNGALTGAGVTTVTVDGTIPSWVPATGKITITLASGATTTIAYTAAQSGTGSNFTIDSTSFAGDNALDNAVVRLNGGDFIVTMKVNDNELPFHFKAAPNCRTIKKLVLEPKGNMVVLPGKGIYFKANMLDATGVFGFSTATVYCRKMTLAQALRTKQLTTTLPNVASTNTLTGSGLTAATSKKIVDCPAGYAIEVMGFYLTGHNYNSAADSIALGFWEGTGTRMYTPLATKEATANLICVSHHMGEDERFGTDIIVNDTKGCIQGPVGSSLYVQASTNIAGTTPKADFVVMYRLVKPATRRKYFTSTATYSTSPVTSIVMTPSASLEIPTAGTITLTRHDGTVTTSTYTAYSGGTFTISTGTDFSGTGATGNLDAGATCYVEYYVRDVADPTGQLNQRLAAGKKFWVSTIAAATEVSNPLTDTTNRWFDTTSTNVGASDYQKDALVKIRGYVGSFHANRFGGLFVSGSGVCIGTLAASQNPVLGQITLDEANPNGSDADVSRTIVEADELAVCNSSTVPAFVAYASAAGDIPARFQVAWGEIQTFKDVTGYVTNIA